MSVYNKGYILFIIAFVIILSGCMEQKTPVDKMYDVLETVAKKEKVFEEQQEPLVTLEKQEKEKYDQIIELGMKEYDQIVKLSDEALILTDKRKERMEKETQSLKESKQEFDKMAGLKDKLDEPELKKIAGELNDIMMDRYKAHEELYKNYMTAIEYDKEIYQMFKNKDLSFEELEGKINELNKTYEQVFADNQQFNQYTEEYNKKKLSFYKNAGLKIK